MSYAPVDKTTFYHNNENWNGINDGHGSKYLITFRNI